MAYEPAEKLADNAMTTLEDTMERLGMTLPRQQTPPSKTKSSGLSIRPLPGLKP